MSIDGFNVSPPTTEGVLDPAWLAATVYGDHPGVVVAGVEVRELLVSTATKLRVGLTLEGAGHEVPRDICIKAMVDEVGLRYGGSSAAASEARFYRHLAEPLGKAGLMTPPCLFSAVDPQSNRGIIVMRDLVVEGGRFLSAMSPYSPDEARASLAQLACLHAASWEQPAKDQPWVRRAVDDIAQTSIIPLDLLQELMDGPRGDLLPPAARDAQRLHRGLGRLAERFRARESCLVHGDAHAGNIYVLNGRTGLIDWQLLQFGNWALDVAYHLTAALLPEDRRAQERALLGEYLGALAQAGGPSLKVDEVWDDYRAAMLYGHYLWAITRRVAPDITLEFNRRLSMAVVEHDSYALLGI